MSSIVGQKINDPASIMNATPRANATASINSSFLTMSKVAEQALPLVRNVLEAIIYAVFPFVFESEQEAGIDQYAEHGDRHERRTIEDLGGFAGIFERHCDDGFRGGGRRALRIHRAHRETLRLQRAFGLRREESIKIRPEWADRGDRLALKDTWTKGGRPREIPICNEKQRRALDEAKHFAGRGSLIPADKRYVEQLRRFEHQCAKAGIHRIHGYRHQYAQTRYREITGWAAPAADGPRSKELTATQKVIDQEARLTISSELGHARTQILGIYVGR